MVIKCFMIPQNGSLLIMINIIVYGFVCVHVHMLLIIINICDDTYTAHVNRCSMHHESKSADACTPKHMLTMFTTYVYIMHTHMYVC